MTAPTENQIREAASQQWTRRWREDERLIKLWPGQGLHDHLSDLVFTEFGCGTSSSLWNGDWERAHEAAGLRLDRLVDEAIEPILATFEADIQEALVTALGRFAAEYPHLPRAKPEAVPA